MQGRSPVQPAKRAEDDLPESIGKLLGEVLGHSVIAFMDSAIGSSQKAKSDVPGAISAVSGDMRLVLSRYSRADIACQFDNERETVSELRRRGLEILKRCISQQEGKAAFLTEARSLLGPEPRRVVRALYVRATIRPEDNNNLPLDLGHLSSTSDKVKGFWIKVKTIDSTVFPKSRFMNPDVLKKRFDIIFIGGNDGSAWRLDGLNADVVRRSFVPFHGAGRKVVLLHDSTCQASDDRRWEYFQNQIGSPALPWMSDVNRGMWTQVRRKNPNGPRPPILTTPFNLPDPFPVAPAHAAQISSDHALLIGPRPESTYYVERNGIAFCETGHTPWAVTKYEWRFMVNMVYHMTRT
jgi:hypothetical protein